MTHPPSLPMCMSEIICLRVNKMTTRSRTSKENQEIIWPCRRYFKSLEVDNVRKQACDHYPSAKSPIPYPRFQDAPCRRSICNSPVYPWSSSEHGLHLISLFARRAYCGASQDRSLRPIEQLRAVIVRPAFYHHLACT
jgi:hypothetical protein